jgi:hypothetical protein
MHALVVTLSAFTMSKAVLASAQHQLNFEVLTYTPAAVKETLSYASH